MRLTGRVLCSLLLLFLTSGAAAGGELRLANRHIDTAEHPGFEETAPATEEPAAFRAFSVAASKSGYYLVQFEGPVQESWKRSLEALGVTLYDYVPDFAFLARVPDPEAVSNAPHIVWIGEYLPSDRIDSHAAAKVYAVGEELSPKLMVAVFPERTPEEIGAEVTDMGGTALKYGSDFLMVRIPGTRLNDLAAINGVKWIEAKTKPRVYNNKSAQITDTAAIRPLEGLWGEGQVVAVYDTGFDRGSAGPAFMHPDFTDGEGGSRVLEIFDSAGDGRTEDTDGHGTHVAGSVLGNGLMSGSDPAADEFPSTSFAGMAPKAKLIMQAAGRTGSKYLEVPEDLNVLFAQARDAGADLHSNSWGAQSVGIYNLESQDIDEFMWNNPDFLILFAAGNSGVDKDRDGVVDLYSLDDKSAAKNCITVGATESTRPDPLNNVWGEFGNLFTADPLANDSDSGDPTGMAAFSSRGPTLDGRYKPDIVAPGCAIVSTRSQHPDADGFAMAYNDWYAVDSGTSMSTPMVAGAAALVREYLMESEGFNPPSAALIKAALLNGALDTSPGQYGTDRYREIPGGPGPNNVQGWGRLNLRGSVAPRTPFGIQYHDDTAGLNTGESNVSTFTVSDSAAPLRVLLAWTDYPGSPLAQGGLVNDLDLSVTAPDGTIHYPDKAVKKVDRETLLYNSGDIRDVPDSTVAVRCTPGRYPAHLEGIFLEIMAPYSPGYQGIVTKDVDLVVYAEQGSTNLPGRELWRKRIAYFPPGSNVVGVQGVTITSGDFFVAFEAHGEHELLGNDVNYESRGLVRSGGAWTTADYMPSIGARVSGVVHEGSFDRANNVVGVTLEDPDPGVYSIKVAGYNVPYGPQPYALVANGVTGVLTADQRIVDTDPNQDSPPTVVFTERNREDMSATDVMAVYDVRVASVLSTMLDFKVTLTADPSGRGLMAVRYPVQDLGARKVSSLNLLKFISGESISFNYSEAGEYADGNWWLTDFAGRSLDLQATLDVERDYFVVSVIKDNGRYDLDSVVDAIHDPQLLVAMSPSVRTGGGGGGCTLDTGGESGGLLLLLALAIGIMRIGLRRRV